MAIHASYLRPLFNQKRFDQIVQSSLSVLAPRSHLFDAIAFRGLSGSLIVPVLAYHLNKGMIAVRKEPSHADSRCEGPDCEGFIIVDDFHSSGQTVEAILSAIKASPIKGKPVAAFFWAWGGTDWADAPKLKCCGDKVIDIPVWYNSLMSI